MILDLANEYVLQENFCYILKKRRFDSSNKRVGPFGLTQCTSGVYDYSQSNCGLLGSVRAQILPKSPLATNIGPFMTFLPLPHCALHHLYTFLTPSGAFQPCTIYMELLNLHTKMLQPRVQVQVSRHWRPAQKCGKLAKGWEMVGMVTGNLGGGRE